MKTGSRVLPSALDRNIGPFNYIHSTCTEGQSVTLMSIYNTTYRIIPHFSSKKIQGVLI